MDTVELTSVEQLQQIISGSGNVPVYLFKHSTRCPISHAAHDEYLEFVNALESGSAVCYDLDLLSYREVSAAIAEETGVVHQSPQVIVIVGSEVKWSASHNEITVDSLQTVHTEF